MERVRRLRRLWSWLPAFRAAAESEHLPTAADLLHVSASSISRTVRLLEDELGRPLFERSGRTIRLNRDGQRFLAAVRDAMRILDEGVEEVAGDVPAGPVDVAVPRHLAAVLVLPALDDLGPDLLTRIHASDGTEMHRLTRGALDVAVVERAHPHPDLTVEILCHLGHGVYGAADHPVARKRALSVDALADADFVAADGDHWPIDRPRAVVAHVGDPELALSMCARRPLLTHAPDILATAAVRRLRIDVAAPTPLYLVYRRPVAHHGRTVAVVEALRRRAAAL